MIAVDPVTGSELGRLTLQAGLKVISVLDAAAGEVDLLASDLRALYLLQVVGSQNAGELAKRMFVPQSCVTLIADRLQRRDLLSRARDPRDGRRVVLTITAEGRGVLEAAAVLVRAELKSFFAPLSAAHAQELAVLLGRVVVPGSGGEHAAPPA